MAKDVLPPDYETGFKCPWCDRPVKIEMQIAIYDYGDSTQILGLEKDEDSNEQFGEES